VLALQPDNREARQLLADFYQDAAELDLSWGNDYRAIEMYQRALDYQPQNSRILAALGGCYLRIGDDPAASAYFETALAGGSDNLDVYNEMIHAWFDVDRPDRAWEMLENAETAVEVVPYEFYLAQASYCIAEYIEDVVRPWLERAIEKAPLGVPILVVIGEMAVMEGASEIGQEYLERAILIDQEPGQAYLMLGILAAREGENKAADQYWKQAEKIAHTTHDEDLKRRVQEARLLFSGPPGLMRLLSAFGEGPFGDVPFPDFFEDEFDTDDDEFF
jgi:tetratricopeptide (TPR) repeat protein